MANTYVFLLSFYPLCLSLPNFRLFNATFTLVNWSYINLQITLYSNAKIPSFKLAIISHPGRTQLIYQTNLLLIKLNFLLVVNYFRGQYILLHDNDLLEHVLRLLMLQNLLAIYFFSKILFRVWNYVLQNIDIYIFAHSVCDYFY